MEGLDEVIDERISFLNEQMNPKNKSLVNRAFGVQIQTLRQTDTERLALQILQKKKQLETARDVDTIEQLYAESDALEWLQREVVSDLP